MTNAGWCFFGIDPQTKERQMLGYEGKKYCCYYWRSSTWHISLGVHIDLSKPNFELHIPTGFIRIGMIP
jgi:hypothetical protein